MHRVGERLGARLDDERREVERRDRLAVEKSLAFRLDVAPRHPLAAFESDVAGASRSADTFLLAA